MIDNKTLGELSDYEMFPPIDDIVLTPMVETFQKYLLESLRPKMRWLHEAAPFYCSNCGNDEMYKTKFCPECGAKEESNNNG